MVRNQRLYLKERRREFVEITDSFCFRVKKMKKQSEIINVYIAYNMLGFEEGTFYIPYDVVGRDSDKIRQLISEKCGYPIGKIDWVDVTTRKKIHSYNRKVTTT